MMKALLRDLRFFWRLMAATKNAIVGYYAARHMMEDDDIVTIRGEIEVMRKRPTSVTEKEIS